MTLADKAAERRTRLRAKVETRAGDGRIVPDTPREDRVGAASYLRIGKVRIATEARPRLTRRGVPISRRHVRHEP